MQQQSRSILCILALSSSVPTMLAAGTVGVTSGDGVSLYLDDATGALTGLYAGTTSLRDPNTFGGLYVRDRQHMLDVPVGAPNFLPNPSFELDSDLDSFPDFWQFDTNGTAATVTLEPDPFDGAKSAVIHDFYGASLRASVPVGPGERYVIQARVKGPAQSGIRIYYYDASDQFLYSEYGDLVGASDQWKPVFLVTQVPARSVWAEVRLYSFSNANLTIDMVRMYVAPPAAFAPIVGTVIRDGADAVLTGSMPALGLSVSARFIAAATHVGVDVELTNTGGGDRALEAGFIAPVQAVEWYDHIGDTNLVTQLTSAQYFDYSRCGGRNVDGRCPTERSIYPFGAVSVGGGLGLAIGYDVARGPQDVEFFYSTYTGEALVSRFRVGAAPESLRYPNVARFNLVLFQLDSSADGMRSTLERYYQISAGTFENRLPRVGGWLMYYDASDIAGVEDFGIAVKTRESEVAADDAAGILSYTDIGDFDHRVPMGDYPSMPTPAEAEARIAFNATDPGADPAQIDPARQILVSGGEEASGVTLFDIETSTSIPGSQWSADTLFNLDPDITDRSGSGWSSRFDYWQAIIDQDFVDATSVGAELDGLYLADPVSSLEGMWNSRREHLETADYPLSFDPVSFAPALPTAFSAWEFAKELAIQMRASGRTTMARDLGRENFYLSEPIDALGEYATESSMENLEDLVFFRSLAGRRPFMLQLDAAFATYDMRHAMNIALAHGMTLTPDRDGAVYYWDVPAYLDRDRAMFRHYSALWRLQGAAGWEPVRRATLGVPEMVAERFGNPASGLLLFSAWSHATADIVSPLTIDLAALGIAPGSVRRVVDLVHGRVIPTVRTGPLLELTDTLAPDDVRLYRIHAGAPPSPVVLYAVKRGDDVRLSWTDGGRSLYEVLQSPVRDLAAASLDLASTLGHDDLAAVPASDSRYYAVE